MASRSGDFTVYVRGDQLADLDSAIDKLRRDRGIATPFPPAANDKGSRDCTLKLTMNGRTFSGRALVCRCWDGRYLSVTMRVADQPIPDDDLIQWPAAILSGPSFECTPPWTPPEPTGPGDEATRKMLQRFPAPQQTTGLIVIAGRTGSGKSTYARELLFTYLRQFSATAHAPGPDGHCKGRYPHIVTFEDPVERWLADRPDLAQQHGFDYTPRVKGVDAVDIDEVLTDALRQTPSLVYVGECRQPSDWKAVLRFAGTGHLILTTSHAGSPVEAMSRILEAAKAETPAERSEVAYRIRMIVHVRADERTNARIPAVWHNTRQSVNAMAAEGLASMLPQTLPETGVDPLQGNFGRAFFARGLGDDVLEQAMIWDLAGE